MSELWATVHGERHRLADGVTQLTPEQWAPRACAGDGTFTTWWRICGARICRTPLL